MQFKDLSESSDNLEMEQKNENEKESEEIENEHKETEYGHYSRDNEEFMIKKNMFFDTKQSETHADLELCKGNPNKQYDNEFLEKDGAEESFYNNVENAYRSNFYENNFNEYEEQDKYEGNTNLQDYDKEYFYKDKPSNENIFFDSNRNFVEMNSAGYNYNMNIEDKDFDAELEYENQAVNDDFMYVKENEKIIQNNTKFTNFDSYNENLKSKEMQKKINFDYNNNFYYGKMHNNNEKNNRDDLFPDKQNEDDILYEKQGFIKSNNQNVESIEMTPNMVSNENNPMFYQKIFNYAKNSFDSDTQENFDENNYYLDKNYENKQDQTLNINEKIYEQRNFNGDVCKNFEKKLFVNSELTQDYEKEKISLNNFYEEADENINEVKYEKRKDQLPIPIKQKSFDNDASLYYNKQEIINMQDDNINGNVYNNEYFHNYDKNNSIDFYNKFSPQNQINSKYEMNHNYDSGDDTKNNNFESERIQVKAKNNNLFVNRNQKDYNLYSQSNYNKNQDQIGILNNQNEINLNELASQTENYDNEKFSIYSPLNTSNLHSNYKKIETDLNEIKINNNTCNDNFTKNKNSIYNDEYSQNIPITNNNFLNHSNYFENFNNLDLNVINEKNLHLHEMNNQNLHKSNLDEEQYLNEACKSNKFNNPNIVNNQYSNQFHMHNDHNEINKFKYDKNDINNYNYDDNEINKFNYDKNEINNFNYDNNIINKFNYDGNEIYHDKNEIDYHKNIKNNFYYGRNDLNNMSNENVNNSHNNEKFIKNFDNQNISQNNYLIKKDLQSKSIDFDPLLIPKKAKKAKKQPFEYDVIRMYVKGKNSRKNSKTQKEINRNSSVDFYNNYKDGNFNENSQFFDNNYYKKNFSIANNECYGKNNSPLVNPYNNLVNNQFKVDQENTKILNQPKKIIQSKSITPENLYNYNYYPNDNEPIKKLMKDQSKTNQKENIPYNPFSYSVYFQNECMTGVFDQSEDNENASYTCDPCMKRFKRLSTLKIHIFSHIKDAYIFKCPRINCEAGFKSQSIAIKHISHFHGNDRTALVDHLKRSKFSSIFRSYTALIDYYKLFHPNTVNPFLGSFCFGCFTYPRSFREHPCTRMFFSLTQCPSCKEEIVMGELEKHVESDNCKRNTITIKEID
ncbi:hypothetical protein GVAV_003320 [Gurleya vavrai]